MSVGDASGGPAVEVAPASPFASLSARCAATFLDLVVIALLEWPVSRVVRDAGFASQLLVQLLPALYLVLAYTSVGGGQTVGKWLLGLRVVDVRGAPLSLAASARRWTVAVGVAWPLWWLRPTGPDLRMPPAIVGWAVLTVVLAVLLVDSWLLIADPPARRSLHDLAAGSYVVRRRANPYQAPPARGQWLACVLLAVLAGLVSLPVWRAAAALAPRAVELARVSATLGRTRGLTRLTAWPAYRASRADTIWRVTIYASFATRRPAGAEADDTVHALACAFARHATHAVRDAEIDAATLFAGEGAVPSGLRFLPQDITPAACAP